MNVNDWFNMVGYKKTTRPHDPMCFWNEDEEYEIWFSKYYIPLHNQYTNMYKCGFL